MKTKSAVLLINLDSRRSRSARPRIEAACRKNGITIEKTCTLGSKEDTLEAIRQIKKQRQKLVIVAGGDGTISTIAGLLAGSPTEIGIVALGTTNNFARSLNLSPDIEEAVQIIAREPASPVSLGKINQRYFTNVVGVGISALVAERVTDQQKRRWGRLAYAVVGARELIRHQAFQVTLTDKDRELQMHFETHQLIIANGRFHAGKEIAADARVDNRDLIVFAIGGRRRINFIRHMIDFYLGKRKSVKHSSYLIARDIRISTDQPQQVELDGEVRFQTPLRVRSAPRSINVKYRRQK